MADIQKFVQSIESFVLRGCECKVSMKDIILLESGGRSGEEDDFYGINFQSCVGEEYTETLWAGNEEEAIQNALSRLESYFDKFRKTDFDVGLVKGEDYILCSYLSQGRGNVSENGQFFLPGFQQ